MKKFLACILLTISMLSFFILLTNYENEELANIKNVEHHLENSYTVLITDKINSFPRGLQYEKYIESSKESQASIYFTRIDREGENPKIIKYILTTNNDYVDNFTLIKGTTLDYSLMGTDYFLSNRDTGDPNQIGQISTVNGIEFEIRTLSSIFDDGFIVDGTCTVVMPEGTDIKEFTDCFNVEFGDNTLEVSETFDIAQTEDISYIKISVLFIILLLIILYSILKSYKKIGIQKLYGYSYFDIWMEIIRGILTVEIITMLISTVAMSLIMIEDINLSYLQFYKELIVMYIAIVGITIIVSSIPFLYVYTIKITSVLKNKSSIKEILIVNNMIKISLSIFLIALVNVQLINYKEANDTFLKEYDRWTEVSQYRVLSLDEMSDLCYSNPDASKKIYNYFNEKGAIFASFDYFTELDKSVNSSCPVYMQIGLVNPNYLKINNVYDIEGNIVEISEENKNWVLLVPEKYSEYEEEMIEYYTTFMKNDGQPEDVELEIIWTQNNQRLFSYNFAVNAEDGNYVEDPVLFVGTENGGFNGWQCQLFNVIGNPFKVKLGENETADADIIPIIEEYGGVPGYYVRVNYADEEIKYNYDEYKSLFIKLTISIISTLLVISIILVQNVYNYFEQYKIKLSLRKLNGYSLRKKYEEHILIIILGWIVALSISFILNLASKEVILCISSVGLIIELIISILLLVLNEKKNMVKLIKGGI